MFYYTLVSSTEKHSQVHPEFQVVYVGSRVIIECHSTTNPRWLKNGKSFESHIVGDSIIFPYAKEEYNGLYTCIGTSDDGGRQFSANSQLHVGGIKEIFYYRFLKKG